MLTELTHARLEDLSAWQPPPGFCRVTTITDDGNLEVLLEYQGVVGGAGFGSVNPIGADDFRELDSIAAEMVAEAAENERRNRAANVLMRRNARISEERRFASECGEACRGGAKMRAGINPMAG